MGTTTKSLSLSLSFTALLFALLLHFNIAQDIIIAGSESEALELADADAAAAAADAASKPEKRRETLEIIIGGGGIGIGGGSSPAPSPECPPPPPPPPCPPSRLEKARKVLLNFKKLINDPTCYTQNWNEQTETCNFKGIKCATYPDENVLAVAGLDFNQAAFTGQNGAALLLTGILDSIPELTFFHVNSNNFSSSIPDKIATYPFFFELDLSNNKLVGDFPKVILQSTQLVFLDIRFNSLRGPVPPQLFKKDLDVIFINNNQFSGCLPETFGSTPARFITLANNQFTGPIPKSIGNTSNTLTEVLFLNNRFDGCLPYEIGYLKKLVVFDVSKNLLTGPIPHSFACLDKIRYLNLAHNKFYGVVPDSVCLLPGIRKDGNLSLEGNYFTGLGAACWSLIKSKVLDVSNNCIPGLPNQRSIKECYEFSCKVKPCTNYQSLTYIPCKPHWQQQNKKSTADQPTDHSAPEPVSYKSLKPHRLRL